MQKEKLKVLQLQHLSLFVPFGGGLVVSLLFRARAEVLGHFKQSRRLDTTGSLESDSSASSNSESDVAPASLVLGPDILSSLHVQCVVCRRMRWTMPILNFATVNPCCACVPSVIIPYNASIILQCLYMPKSMLA